MTKMMISTLSLLTVVSVFALTPQTALAQSERPVQSKPLEVVGTGDGMELVRAVGLAFSVENPETTILVPPSIGSGGGIASVGAGKSPLARVARDLKPEEIANGLKIKNIFRLPTAIYVNSALGVYGISSRELIDIYEGRTVNWSKVGGPDQKIKVVRREDTDSSLSVLRNSMPGWSKIDITSRSKTAVTTQGAVETVSSVAGAVGFGPFSRNLESSVRVLKIDGRYPTDSGYPSAVTVSYVWRSEHLTDSARAFIDFGGTREATDLLIALGALPISSKE